MLPDTPGNEGWFRQAVECTPTALVLVGVDGRIAMVNRQTEILFGHRRHDMLHQPLEMLVPDRHRSAHLGLRRSFLDAPQTRPMGAGRDLFGQRKDGSEFPIEIGLNRIDTEHGVMVLSAIIDISGRKQLEAQLRQAMESLHQSQTEFLESVRHAEKMRALTDMTGGIAHDFNNVLTVIVANIETVRNSGEVTSPRMLRALDYAVRGSARAATLTANLLAFSGQQELIPSALEPNFMVESMSEMLARTIRDTISVTTALPPGTWQIWVDGNRLEDALLNLALNARDAMPDGGRLSLATSNIRLDLGALADDDMPPPGDYVMIEVSDDGCGIPKDVRKRIFEPFFTTKDVGKGTGLGLSQVYGFVRQSGGWVRVDSAPGKGTVFKLYFPRLVAGGADQAPADGALISAGQHRGVEPAFSSDAQRHYN
jgi:PAS domain S-box-containing protein